MIYIYIHIIQLYPVFGYVYYHLNQHMAYPFKPYPIHDISPHPPRPPRWLPQQNPGRVLVVSTTWGGAVWIIKNMGLGYNYTRVYHMGLQIGYKVYIYRVYNYNSLLVFWWFCTSWVGVITRGVKKQNVQKQAKQPGTLQGRWKLQYRITATVVGIWGYNYREM